MSTATVGVDFYPNVLAPAVEAFLLLVASTPNATPTLIEIVETCAAAGVDRKEVARLLADALAAGLVDSDEDYGPESFFVLSALGAEKLGLRLTYDSRRWITRRGGKLVGPPDPEGRYRNRRPRKGDEEGVIPLHAKVDTRQHRPDEILSAVEEAAKEGPKAFSSLNPPPIRRFYGMNAIWRGEELISGTCPYCKGEKLSVDGYCLKCHNAGADRFLPKVTQNRRRHMPEQKSGLKGGV